MSEANYMNREELLKLAALDVFGLLEPFEAELFNRSYHNAPASVQDEVATLQAELAADPIFLSDEKPAASLRERVLERVARAVEEEAAKLAPLATIGRGRYTTLVDPAAIRGLSRSAMIWRAASFVLAACLVLAIGLFLNATREGNEIAQLALQGNSREKLRELIGPDLEYFLANATSRTMLRPVGATDAFGEIWMNERTGQAFALGLDMPKGQYTLQARTADGRALALKEFQSDGAFASARVDDVDLLALGVTTMSALTWEVIDRAGNLVLSTA